MKLFEINDTEYWLAATEEEATKFYNSDSVDPLEEIHEIPKESFDHLQILNDPEVEEDWVCECGAKLDNLCRWNGKVWEHHHGYPIGHVAMKNTAVRSFREHFEKEMQRDSITARLFASSEY